MLREFTKQAQRDAANARELTDQVQSLLVASRNAVDTVTIPQPGAVEGTERAGHLTEDERKFAEQAATHLQQATMAVVTGQPSDPAAYVTALIAGIKAITTSEEFAPIREILAREIVNMAAQQIVRVTSLQMRHGLSEDTVKLLLKVAIQGIRGAVTTQDVAKVIEHAPR
jgi:hypothetical protein